MTDALTTDKDAQKGVIGTITVGDQKFTIARRPHALLLSELARTGSGDPEALGVLSEFFEVVLAGDYRAFKRAVYSQDFAPGEDFAFLMEKLREVIEQATGRPTA